MGREREGGREQLTYIYIYMHVYAGCLFSSPYQIRYVHMYINTYIVCMYVHVHTAVITTCSCIEMYQYTCMYMCTCIYVHHYMYVRTMYIQQQSMCSCIEMYMYTVQLYTVYNTYIVCMYVQCTCIYSSSTMCSCIEMYMYQYTV